MEIVNIISGSNLQAARTGINNIQYNLHSTNILCDNGTKLII
jgi:hypothetical protein